MINLPWYPDPPVRLLQYGVQTIDVRWAFRLDDPFWRLYLNDEAGAETCGPGWTHRLDPGRIHILPAWCRATSRCRGRIVHSYVHVDCGDWGRAAFSRPIALVEDPAQAAALRRLCAAPRWDIVARAEARALAATCLARAVAALDRQALTRLDPEGDPHDPVAQARRFLAERLAEPQPLDRVAAAVGLSPGHLRARFRAAVGRTPAAWLRERRVAAAAERLLVSDDPIDAVASACGFADRFHFSRIFARLLGSGPAAYRKARRQAPGQPAGLRPTPGP